MATTAAPRTVLPNLDTLDSARFGSATRPTAGGEHPKQHLGNFTGILQADGYAGFHHLYEAGRIQEAACWAHVRRKCCDMSKPTLRSWRPGPWSVWRLCTRSRVTFAANRRNKDGRCAGSEACLCWHRCVPGWKRRCRRCRENPIPRPPSVMRLRAEPRWCAIATMAACLPVPMPAVSALPPCTV